MTCVCSLCPQPFSETCAVLWRPGPSVRIIFVGYLGTPQALQWSAALHAVQRQSAGGGREAGRGPCAPKPSPSISLTSKVGRDRAIRKYAPRVKEARRFDARPCPSDKFLAPTQLATHNRARAPPRKHSLAIRKIRTDEATRSTGQAAQRLRGNECARPARRKGLCRRHGSNQRCGGDDSGPHSPTRRAMRPLRRAIPPHFSRPHLARSRGASHSLGVQRGMNRGGRQFPFPLECLFGKSSSVLGFPSWLWC